MSWTRSLLDLAYTCAKTSVMICELNWSAWATLFTGFTAIVSALILGAATLFTGLAAVAAALFVGLRQADIQRRQATISERMASTEEARIRLELFDKRYQFVQTVSAFIRRVRSSHEEWTDEDTAFLTEAREAEFLFPRRLKEIIDRMWILAVDYRDAAEDLDNEEKRFEARQRRRELRASINEAVEEFDRLCAAELRPFKD